MMCAENFLKLKNIRQRPGAVFHWSRSHKKETEKANASPFTVERVFEQADQRHRIICVILKDVATAHIVFLVGKVMPLVLDFEFIGKITCKKLPVLSLDYNCRI